MKFYDKEHAMIYADNATKIFMFEKFNQLYPNLFKHAILETRLADSSKDFYVPPNLADKCLVVKKLAWTEKGCGYISCLSLTEKLEPCNDEKMRWVRVGFTDYTLACQPACENSMTKDTIYRNGDCYEANPAKKIFVMFPEQYNGMTAKHARLSLIDDHLALNELYCKHYVLNFKDGDCYLNDYQYAAEIFMGTTVYRKTALKSTKPKIKDKIRPPTPPPVPLDEFENAWLYNPPKNKRSVINEKLDNLVDEMDIGGIIGDNDTDYMKLAKEIATEISIEYGIEVSLRAISTFLEKYASKLVVKMATNVSVKHAIINMIIKTQISTLLKVSKATQAALTGVKSAASLAKISTIIYGVMSLLVDIFDPYEFGSVLTKKKVDEIDLYLDLKYFETGNFQDIKITPEDVWTDLLHKEGEKGVTEMIMYFAERYEEYMAQIHNTEKSNFENNPVSEILKDSTNNINNSSGSIGIGMNNNGKSFDYKPKWILMVVILAVSVLFLNHVEYIAFTLFGIFLISQYF